MCVRECKDAPKHRIAVAQAEVGVGVKAGMNGRHEPKEAGTGSFDEQHTACTFRNTYRQHLQSSSAACEPKAILKRRINRIAFRF